MDTVTVSPKYQVVIPRRVRDALDIQVGHKIQVLLYGDRIEMIPVKSMREMRGFLRGIDTTIERENDRV